METQTVSLKTIYELAIAAGRKAWLETAPTPVAWQSSGIGESFDYNKPYQVDDNGLCGFAWVNVYGVDARTKFGKEMIAQFKLRKDYDGSYKISSYDIADGSIHGQSVEKKEAACQAFAEVLRRYGFRAYGASRLD